MRLDDIRLWEAARGGEAKACLEIAARYFRGGNGLPQDFSLGLAYLQQQLNEGSPAAIVLVGELVPLEILTANGCWTTLLEAARLGSQNACFKLAISMMLRESGRGEALHWIKLSQRASQDGGMPRFEDPLEFAQILRMANPSDVVDRVGVALSGAHAALKESGVQDACYCIKAAAHLAPQDKRIAEAVSLTIQLAAIENAELFLPIELIESSLWIRSEQGEIEAQYGLGCAFGGLPYGHLAPKQVVKRLRPGYAASLLLRAADAGKCEAWWTLSQIESHDKSVAANRTMSRFFLEKAAQSGVLQAQTRLGAALLREASSVETAEVGVQWLSQAADRGDSDAAKLLQTLILPLPQLPTEYVSSVIEQIRGMNPELGARLALARALHLTRHETITFNATPNFRSWGLCMQGASNENPKGRLVPAVSPHMKTELQRASSFFSATSALENALVNQRGRTQRRLFKALAIPEHLFFAKEIGRSWSHHGFGRHWATQAGPLLNAALDRREAGVSRHERPTFSGTARNQAESSMESST